MNSYRLRPAVGIDCNGSTIRFRYRAQEFQIELGSSPNAVEIRTSLRQAANEPVIAAALGLRDKTVGHLLSGLRDRSMLAPISPFEPTEHYMSGIDAYLNLECDLCSMKFEGGTEYAETKLESQIAHRLAAPSVAAGYLIEIGYLLRHVPNELSRAIASAEHEAIRSVYMDFFDDESRHGEMIFAELCKWIPRENLLLRRPLPSTLGLLHTYMCLAERGPLSYAVALMRDESLPIDPRSDYDAMLYESLRNHYNIPKNVVDIFEWHANLDRDTSHGSVPESVFSLTPVVAQNSMTSLKASLRSMFEMHGLLRKDILETYSRVNTNEWGLLWK